MARGRNGRGRNAADGGNNGGDNGGRRGFRAGQGGGGRGGGGGGDGGGGGVHGRRVDGGDGENRTLLVFDGTDPGVVFQRNADGTWFLRYQVTTVAGAINILCVSPPTEDILRDYHQDSECVRSFNNVIRGDEMAHFHRFEREVHRLASNWGGAAVRDDIRVALSDFQREGRRFPENQITRFDNSVNGGLIVARREQMAGRYDAIHFLFGPYAGVDFNDAMNHFGDGDDAGDAGGAGGTGGATAI